MQPISPTSVVSRIWDLYRDQFAVLIGTAICLYALQFVINLILPGSAGVALAILFWALSILYQGMVVKLVQDVQDGRRDNSIGDLVRGVEPVFWPLVAVSILFGLGVGIGFILLIVPGDFFRVSPVGRRYILANVLHDWDDRTAVRILGACRRANGRRRPRADRRAPDSR